MILKYLTGKISYHLYSFIYTKEPHLKIIEDSYVSSDSQREEGYKHKSDDEEEITQR